MNLCKDCIFSEKLTSWWCRFDKDMLPVDGEGLMGGLVRAAECQTCRLENGHCGKEGKHFKARFKLSNLWKGK